MNKFLVRILAIVFLLLIFISIPALLYAQQPPPGDCDPLDIKCPIDGGLSLLLAAGIGYGIKKIRNSRTKDASAI